MVTREEIIDRLKYAQLTIGTSRQNFFASAVPERRTRRIVAIILFGDGTASRTVEIEKVKETDPVTYDMIFDNVPVSPAGVVPLPPEGPYDIENPIVVLEGGTNISAIANAGSPEATLIYWDEPPT